MSYTKKAKDATLLKAARLPQLPFFPSQALTKTVDFDHRLISTLEFKNNAKINQNRAQHKCGSMV